MPQELDEFRKNNNPNNEPVGHFTGRCSNCHSRDLWDDAAAYGCNCCGAVFMTGNIPPRAIHNQTGEVTEFGEWKEFDQWKSRN